MTRTRTTWAANNAMSHMEDRDNGDATMRGRGHNDQGQEMQRPGPGDGYLMATHDPPQGQGGGQG
jgi:hypothetical protein